MKKQTSLIKYGGKVMFNTVSLDEMIRDSIREKDWSKLTVDKTVNRINTMPEFLYSKRGSLVLEVALEDEDKMRELTRLLPEVFRGVEEGRAQAILKSLLVEESLHKRNHVRNKVITSFGWGLEEINNLIKDDYELVGKYCTLLNSVTEELKEEGYYRVLIDVVRGTITRVSSIKVNDLFSDNVWVDIVHEDKITHSNYTK